MLALRAKSSSVEPSHAVIRAVSGNGWRHLREAFSRHPLEARATRCDSAKAAAGDVSLAWSMSAEQKLRNQ